MFKKFRTLALVSAILAFGISVVGAITILTNPFGTGATVAFNQFTDAINLAEDRGYGVPIDAIYNNNGACLALPALFQQDLVVGGTTIPWENIYRFGYPYFNLTCIANAFGSNSVHLDESQFAAGRICDTSNCGGVEPQIDKSQGNTFVTNAIPFFVLGPNNCNSSAFLQATFNPGTNVCWVRPKLPDYDAIPDYDHSLATLSDGDRIRLFIYIHNTAEQFNPGTPEYIARLATNTNVSFAWSNPTTVAVAIDSDQTSPINDTVSLAFANSALSIRPVTNGGGNVAIQRFNSGATSNVAFNGGTSLLVPMGTVASSFGNTQSLYVDFEVFDTTPPDPEFEVVKTAQTLAGIELSDGENITDTQNIGPGDQYQYTVTVTNTSTQVETGTFQLTDVLDNNLTFVTGGAGVTHNGVDPGGTVQLNFPSIPINGSASRSFTVQIVDPLPSSPLSLVNTVVDSTITLIVEEDPVDPVDDLILTKSQETPDGVVIPNGTELEEGDIFHYRIRVERPDGSGSSPDDVIVLDALNQDLTFVSNLGDSDITHNAGLVTLNFGPVPVGTSNAIEKIFAVQINDPVIGSTTGGVVVIPNTATSGKITSNTVNVVVAPADPQPELLLTKSQETPEGVIIPNGEELEESDIFHYRIRVERPTNSLPVNEDVVVIDVLDQNLVFVSNLGDTDITHDGALNGGTVQLDFGTVGTGPANAIEKVFAVQVKDPLITVGVPIKDGLIGIANFATTGNITSNTVTIVVATEDEPDFILTKSQETPEGVVIPNGGAVEPGQIFHYRIRVESLMSHIDAQRSSVIVTDILTPNLSFVSNLGDPNITHDSGTVTLDFGPVLPGPINAEEKVFAVQVADPVIGITDATGTVVIPNFASIGDIDSNIVTVIVEDEPTTTGGGGGGGGTSEVLPTTGICHRFPNGSYECRKAFPEFDLGDPDYQEFLKCVDDNIYTDDECLDAWAIAKDIPGCTPPEDFVGSQLGQDPSLIAYEQCNPVILPVCDANTHSDQGHVTITKDVLKTAVAVGDSIDYRVSVQVDPGGVQNILFDGENGYIESMRVKIYDYAIPSRGGWLHNREFKENSGWKWQPSEYIEENGVSIQNGNYFWKEFTRDRGGDVLNQLYLGGVGQSFQYSMESSLIGCKPGKTGCHDSDTIDNVAFAVIDFTLKKEISNGEFNTIVTEQVSLREDFSGDSRNNAFVENQVDQCDVLYLEDLHSLGDIARAQCTVVRPFIQTRGGANLAINSSERITGEAENIAGAGDKRSSTGNFFRGELNQGLSQDDIFQDRFFDSLKQNISEDFLRLGTFTTTPDNAGVYFLDNGDFQIPAKLDLGRSETFVIENGNLIIKSDLITTGDSRAYIPAFVVKNGNIIIEPGVQRLEGIFIALNGKVLSGKDGGERSDVQLNISGSLVGDAFDLLKQRKHIGTFNDGVLAGGLQPSVKITYDLRLIENTPPALENFLGSNWQQAIE